MNLIVIQIHFALIDSQLTISKVFHSSVTYLPFSTGEWLREPERLRPRPTGERLRDSGVRLRESPINGVHVSIL